VKFTRRQILIGSVATAALASIPILALAAVPRGTGVSSRRAVLRVQAAMREALELHMFEPNDHFTRHSISDHLMPLMGELHANREVRHWTVICTEANNPPSVIDSRRCVLEVYLQFNSSIEYTHLTAEAMPPARITELAGVVPESSVP